MNKCLII
ncbi:hypothetical protein D048_4600A, partial [Vibrio parahaemolyticus VPTS-2009]